MTVTDQDGFYRAAIGILAREGRDGLKITTLCQQVGVTTGSFHHWFAGWSGFVGYLLDRWEHEETVRLSELALQQSTPQARIDSLRTFALSFPHAAEAAIRAWAHLDPAVATVQRRVDTAREEAIFTALAEAVPDIGVRRTRASLALAVLIGYQQRQDVPEAPALEVLLDEVLRLQGLLGPATTA